MKMETQSIPFMLSLGTLLRISKDSGVTCIILGVNNEALQIGSPFSLIRNNSITRLPDGRRKLLDSPITGIAVTPYMNGFALVITIDNMCIEKCPDVKGITVQQFLSLLAADMHVQLVKCTVGESSEIYRGTCADIIEQCSVYSSRIVRNFDNFVTKDGCFFTRLIVI